MVEFSWNESEFVGVYDVDLPSIQAVFDLYPKGDKTTKKVYNEVYAQVW